MTNDLSIRMHDGTVVEVPADLSAITTYVLLEQERWFEKEPDFLAAWLKPGMTVIDIGANLGLYSLPMARQVGPDGNVFAYEPGSDTRRRLTASRVANGAANLHILASALSDSVRDGRLAFGTSSELNALGDGGDGEAVQITTLDAEDRAHGWQAVDFIKIDAEGEEERILNGGAAFFAKHSPLVMFEVKAGDASNESLRAAFAAKGFGIYRLLPGAPVLVPFALNEQIDNYELNLFAAMPARAATLARDGVLVDQVPSWDVAQAQDPLALIRSQPFGPPVLQLIGNAPADPSYLQALAAYAVWRSPDVALPQRCAALAFAYETVLTACEKQPTLARLSTLARIASEFGMRGMAGYALKTISDLLRRGNTKLNEPFWPAHPRFDAIAPGANMMEWFAVGSLERYEQLAAFSSLFGTSGVDLDWLSKQPLASTEMERRRVLKRALAKAGAVVGEMLATAKPDHINAALWAAGRVPSTTVR